MTERLRRWSVVLACVMGTVNVTGCVRMPTERQGVSDLHPQISFKAASDQAHGARVLIDGLDMGPVERYLDGEAALRVLPGAHMLRVTAGERNLLEERIYVGDGVNRTFEIR